MAERPEDYRWCSLGYHVQAGNPDGLLCLDFDLTEFGVMDATGRLRHYRRYVYEAGAIPRPDRPADQTIEDDILASEREWDFNLDRIKRFWYRTRYFTDSGIIGTKAFVSAHYQQFKSFFQSKHDKRPKPIQGPDGIFSLKRLSPA